MTQRHTILVVDDDEDVREMLVEYLGGVGFGVVTAADADQMWVELALHPVDLVLLDRTMPGGDALGLVPRLQRGHRVGVIVLTALSAEGERIVGLEGGADDYVGKPFIWRELVARIQAVLRRTAPARRGSPMATSTEVVSHGRPGRRTAAVLFADLVDYTRLMGEDEDATLRAWLSHREAVIAPAVPSHGGRVVKYLGDGVLAEFVDPLGAARCAVAIQNALARRNEAVPLGNRLRLRIGIHLASIVVTGDADIYGEGVNLAARILTEAEPGGICVSEAVRDAVDEATDASDESALFAFEDLGWRQLKNIDRPVRVYALGSVHSRPCAPVNNCSQHHRESHKMIGYAAVDSAHKRNEKAEDGDDDGMVDIPGIGVVHRGVRRACHLFSSLDPRFSWLRAPGRLGTVRAL